MNEESNKEISRRKFFLKVSLGLAGIGAVAVAIPVVSALIAPLLNTPEQEWRSVGTLDDFKTGSTTMVSFTNADPKPYAGITAQSAAWLRRTDQNNFIAFAANCTHLGCPVRWEKGAHLFMCPCHGGVYYEDGTVAAGPPPKSLTRYDVRVQNNEVQIRTAPVPITSITASKKA